MGHLPLEILCHIISFCSVEQKARLMRVSSEIRHLVLSDLSKVRSVEVVELDRKNEKSRFDSSFLFKNDQTSKVTVPLHHSSFVNFLLNYCPNLEVLIAPTKSFDLSGILKFRKRIKYFSCKSVKSDESEVLMYFFATLQAYDVEEGAVCHHYFHENQIGASWPMTQYKWPCRLNCNKSTFICPQSDLIKSLTLLPTGQPMPDFTELFQNYSFKLQYLHVGNFDFDNLTNLIMPNLKVFVVENIFRLQPLLETLRFSRKLEVIKIALFCDRISFYFLADFIANCAQLKHLWLQLQIEKDYLHEPLQMDLPERLVDLTMLSDTPIEIISPMDMNQVKHLSTNFELDFFCPELLECKINLMDEACLGLEDPYFVTDSICESSNLRLLDIQYKFIESTEVRRIIYLIRNELRNLCSLYISAEKSNCPKGTCFHVIQRRAVPHLRSLYWRVPNASIEIILGDMFTGLFFKKTHPPVYNMCSDGEFYCLTPSAQCSFSFIQPMTRLKKIKLQTLDDLANVIQDEDHFFPSVQEVQLVNGRCENKMYQELARKLTSIKTLDTISGDVAPELTRLILTIRPDVTIKQKSQSKFPLLLSSAPNLLQRQEDRGIPLPKYGRLIGETRVVSCNCVLNPSKLICLHSGFCQAKIISHPKQFARRKKPGDAKLLRRPHGSFLGE